MTTTDLPELTNLEKTVFAACRMLDEAQPGSSPSHADIIYFSGMPPRSLGGAIRSMAKKGYLIPVEKNTSGVVHVTCRARQAFKLTPAPFCADETCSLH